MDEKNVEDSQFVEVEIDQVLDITECALLDVYIFLSNQKKYVPALLSGFQLTKSKKIKIDEHTKNKVFVLKDQFEEIQPFGSYLSDEVFENVPPVTKEHLRLISLELLNKHQGNPELLIQYISQVADGILEELNPTSASFDLFFHETFQDEKKKEDAKILSAIAINIAHAAKFNSIQSFKDLAQACLIMDVGLSNVSEEHMNLYYLGEMDSAPELKDKILGHTKQAEQIIATKLAPISDVVKSLVVIHHERYDGSGFPDRLKNFSIFPMAQVLCLAVDVFETMKRKAIQKEKTSLYEILNQIYLDFHNKSERHSRSLISTLAQNLQLKLPPEP